jgi:PAB-dependent poly(A)-specific ribonuclease subunit 3
VKIDHLVLEKVLELNFSLFFCIDGREILGNSQTGLLAESLIWEYVVQISSLIRTLHAASLACRCLHLSRLLVDGDSKAGRAKSRVWLSGIGIADILDGSINGPVHQHIQNDLQDFGRLILMLACNSIVGAQKEHLQTSLDIVQRSYSHDLKNLIL